MSRLRYGSGNVKVSKLRIDFTVHILLCDCSPLSPKFPLFVAIQYYMKRFTTYIVDLMKQEKFFAPQGGPIVLSQASIIK